MAEDRSHLPQQLQQQMAEADRLAVETGLMPADPNTPAPAPVPPAPVQDVEPVRPVADDDDNDDPTPEPQGQDWEQKYKVLQGKYSKEVPRLATQVREQADQMQRMQEQLEALSQTPTGEVGQVTLPDSLQVTAQEVEDYGDDMLALVRKVALAAILPEVNNMRALVEEIRRGVVGTQAAVAKNDYEIFLEKLDSQKKNWRTINRSAGFVEWLDGVDDLTGLQRKTLLTDAYNAKDVRRTLAFINSYEASIGSTEPEARKPVAPKAPETSLEALAAPGAGRPAQAAVAPDFANEIWTNPEIDAFYADVRAGKFRGKDAEKLAIEQRIARAASTGRVR